MTRYAKLLFLMAITYGLVAVLGGCGSPSSSGDGQSGSEGQPSSEQEHGQASTPSAGEGSEEETEEAPEVSVGYDSDDVRSQLFAELYARALDEGGFEATAEEGLIGMDVVQGYSESGEPPEGLDGRVMLEPAAGVDDRYVMSTTAEQAEVEGLADVDDLLEIEDPEIYTEVSAGDPREGGPLQEFYERHPETEGRSAFDYLPGNLFDGSEASYDHLGSSSLSEADAVLGWSTDGEIAAQELAVLEDAQKILPQTVYRPAPMVDEGLPEEHPEAQRVLERLSAALETQDVRVLMARVDVEDEDSAEAVADHYEENLAQEVSR